MTRGRSILLILACTGTLAVAACSSTTSTPAAVPTPAAATPAAPTPAAPSIALPTIAIPSLALPSLALPSLPVGSFALPSFVGDATLASLLPAQITGHPCQNQTALIAQFLQQLQSNPETVAAFQAFVAAIGVPIEQISIGFGQCTVTVNGQDTNVSYSAIRAPSADGNKVMQAFITITKAQDATQVVNVGQSTVGGKNVTTVTAANEDITFLYAKGDVVFQVPTNHDDAVDAAVLQALP